MAGVLGPEISRFSGDFLTIGFNNPASAGDLLREQTQTAEVFNQAADGSRFRTAQGQNLAKLKEQRVDFVLAQIGMLGAETFDLFDDPLIPRTGAAGLGRAGLGIERIQFAAAFFEQMSPVKQGAPFNPKGVNGGRESVL